MELLELKKSDEMVLRRARYKAQLDQIEVDKKVLKHRTKMFMKKYRNRFHDDLKNTMIY